VEFSTVPSKSGKDGWLRKLLQILDLGGAQCSVRRVAFRRMPGPEGSNDGDRKDEKWSMSGDASVTQFSKLPSLDARAVHQARPQIADDRLAARIKQAVAAAGNMFVRWAGSRNSGLTSQSKAPS
jgi:hypothetical protein